MFRKVLVVAVTGAASAAAFTAPPAGLPLAGGAAAPLRAAAPRSVRSASLSLEMARVPFIAGNWKMNPGSVEEVARATCPALPCLPPTPCPSPLLPQASVPALPRSARCAAPGA
jgi:hypothetical protein